MQHHIETTEPLLEITDLRAFGRHRLRASVLLTVMDHCDLPNDRVDEFVEAVNVLAIDCLFHGRGAVRVPVWAGPSTLTARVSENPGG